MGMLYRRKKRDPVTGLLVEHGPWWMKYYDGGKPIYESTAKIEKREALILLRRAETKVADGQQEGSAVKRTRFEDLIEELNRLHPQAAQDLETARTASGPPKAGFWRHAGEGDHDTQTSGLRGQAVRRGSSPSHRE